MTPNKTQLYEWMAIAGIPGFDVPAARAFRAAYAEGCKAGMEESVKIVASMDSYANTITAGDCIVAIRVAMKVRALETKQEKPE